VSVDFDDLIAGAYDTMIRERARGARALGAQLLLDLAAEMNGDVGDIVATLRTDFPLIKGFVWFDIDKERQWNIDSSPASLTAYEKLASDPYLNP
jgi:hypothetical protein